MAKNAKNSEAAAISGMLNGDLPITQSAQVDSSQGQSWIFSAITP